MTNHELKYEKQFFKRKIFKEELRWMRKENIKYENIN